MDAPATITLSNKSYWLTVLAVMLSSGLALPACSSMNASTPDVHETATDLPQPSELMASATSTLTPTPTLTETPSSTPSPTATPGPSATPAPTPVFGSARVGNDFLFGNPPEGCELPCWQGLVIGKSDAHDVQKTFETAFGFLGIADIPPEDIFVASDISGLLRLSHQWFFGDSGDTFFVAGLTEKNTQVLEVVRFYGSGNQFEPYVSPQSILRELGTPSHILVSLGITEAANWANLQLMIIYDKGITVYYGVWVLRVLDRGQQDGSDLVAELCLGNITKYPFIDVLLTKPFESNDIEALLLPLQYTGIDLDKIHAEDYKPFEEVFGMSLEEVTKLAQEKNNACIYAPMP